MNSTQTPRLRDSLTLAPAASRTSKQCGWSNFSARYQASFEAMQRLQQLQSAKIAPIHTPSQSLAGADPRPDLEDESSNITLWATLMGIDGAPKFRVRDCGGNHISCLFTALEYGLALSSDGPDRRSGTSIIGRLIRLIPSALGPRDPIYQRLRLDYAGDVPRYTDAMMAHLGSLRNPRHLANERMATIRRFWSRYEEDRRGLKASAHGADYPVHRNDRGHVISPYHGAILTSIFAEYDARLAAADAKLTSASSSSYAARDLDKERAGILLADAVRSWLLMLHEGVTSYTEADDASRAHAIESADRSEWRDRREIGSQSTTGAGITSGGNGTSNTNGPAHFFRDRPLDSWRMDERLVFDELIMALMLMDPDYRAQKVGFLVFVVDDMTGEITPHAFPKLDAEYTYITMVARGSRVCDASLAGGSAAVGGSSVVAGGGNDGGDAHKNLCDSDSPSWIRRSSRLYLIAMDDQPIMSMTDAFRAIQSTARDLNFPYAPLGTKASGVAAAAGDLGNLLQRTNEPPTSLMFDATSGTPSPASTPTMTPTTSAYPRPNTTSTTTASVVMGGRKSVQFPGLKTLVPLYVPEEASRIFGFGDTDVTGLEFSCADPRAARLRIRMAVLKKTDARGQRAQDQTSKQQHPLAKLLARAPASESNNEVAQTTAPQSGSGSGKVDDKGASGTLGAKGDRDEFGPAHLELYRQLNAAIRSSNHPFDFLRRVPLISIDSELERDLGTAEITEIAIDYDHDIQSDPTAAVVASDKVTRMITNQSDAIEYLMRKHYPAVPVDYDTLIQTTSPIRLCIRTSVGGGSGGSGGGSAGSLLSYPWIVDLARLKDALLRTRLWSQESLTTQQSLTSAMDPSQRRPLALPPAPHREAIARRLRPISLGVPKFDPGSHASVVNESISIAIAGMRSAHAPILMHGEESVAAFAVPHAHRFEFPAKFGGSMVMDIPAAMARQLYEMPLPHGVATAQAELLRGRLSAAIQAFAETVGDVTKNAANAALVAHFQSALRLVSRTLIEIYWFRYPYRRQARAARRVSPSPEEVAAQLRRGHILAHVFDGFDHESLMLQMHRLSRIGVDVHPVVSSEHWIRIHAFDDRLRMALRPSPSSSGSSTADAGHKIYGQVVEFLRPWINVAFGL